MANRYNTGKTKSNPRDSKVYDRRTISRGLDVRGDPITRAIVQARYKPSPKQQAKG